MRAKVLIALFILGAVAACNKDKFTTEPKLTFKSVNGEIFGQGAQVRFVIGATDKEGDIKDTLWVQRRSFKCPEFVSDSGVAYPLSPDLVKKNNLDFEFEVAYNYDVSIAPILVGCSGKDDSCYFRFWIKDDANHTSDTVVSPTIVLLDQ